MSISELAPVASIETLDGQKSHRLARAFQWLRERLEPPFPNAEYIGPSEQVGFVVKGCVEF